MPSQPSLALLIRTRLAGDILWVMRNVSSLLIRRFLFDRVVDKFGEARKNVITLAKSLGPWSSL